MASLTGNFGALRDFKALPTLVSLQARIGVTFRPGALVGHRVGSNLAEVPLSASARADLVIVGVFRGNETFTASSTDDGNGGALDADGNPQVVNVEGGVISWFDTASSGANKIEDKHRDQPCYAKDDNTLHLTDESGTLSYAGMIEAVNDAGKVRLRVLPQSESYATRSAGVRAAPSMQAVNATLVAGTITIATGITVASNSEVVPILIGALTGTTNFGSLGELKASRVNGAPGTGSITIQAYGDDGALDVDAAGAIRVLIFNP